MKRAVASIFLLGGCTQKRENGCLNTLERITVTSEGSEITCKSQSVEHQLVHPRRSPSCILYGNTIVVSGGCQRELIHNSSVEKIHLDGTNDSTRKNTPVALGLDPHSCSAFCELESGLLLEVGGYDGLDCLRFVSIVDSGTMKARLLAPFCSRLKNSSAIRASDRVAFLFGGWDETRTMRTVFRLTFDKSFSTYDTLMDGLLPYPIEAHSSVKHGDYVFIVGGYDGLSVVNTIIRYSLLDGSSSVLDVKLRVARENHTSQIVMDNLLFVIGGWDGKQALSSIEVFRILSDPPYLTPISVDCDLIEARIRPASVVVDDVIVKQECQE